MDDVSKETVQTSDRAESSGEETAVELVARKVGSAIGTIASKVSGSQTSSSETSGKRDRSAKSQRPNSSANAHDEKRRERKKKKKTAHRRNLRASHAKG